MAGVITVEAQRKFALRKPPGWKPKLPRWTLRFPATTTGLAVTYIGVQARSPGIDTSAAVAEIEQWVKSSAHPPNVVDRFVVVSGRDQIDTKVWSCYWTNMESATKSRQSLNLKHIHSSLDKSVRASIGLWTESFSTSLDKFETNYSGTDYQPGIAQLPFVEQIDHEFTGYWGAARDRIRASAFDDFSGSGSAGMSPGHDTAATGITTHSVDDKDTHFRGSNTTTIAHIRSGQFWQNCSDTERKAYETELEPHLRNGLDDIYQRPQDLGDYGLRFLRNIPKGSQQKEAATPLRETCAAGFFRSLADLEAWAKDCPSHHKIYGGSMHHRNKFGGDAKMRTWHEICVLRPGEASWEYVNCLPDTGTLSFQTSERVI